MVIVGTFDTGFEGKANGKDDCNGFGFSNGVDDGESSPRFLGPLKRLVGGGTTQESEVGHCKVVSKVDCMSTGSSSISTDASSMSEK